MCSWPNSKRLMTGNLMLESLKNFFIMCSGAVASIIDEPRCAIERDKYAGIGATVLSTAVLASLSGGYAVHTTFRSIPLSICLGILWGLIIFNLDRYIVSSLRRQRISPTMSRRERAAVRLREVARALPRLLLAIFISVVITRPIELKLFEREINAHLEIKKSQMLTELEQQKRLEFPQIEELAARNEKLRQEIQEKEKRRDELYELAMSEALGKSGANMTGLFGKGIVFNERWQDYLRAESGLTELKQRNEANIAANEQLSASLQGEREASLRKARAQVEGMDGLLARLQAHSSLTELNESLALASWFIIILFILLETAPIIVKLLSERGPYEEVYEANEHEVYVGERRRVSSINDDANTHMSLNRRKNGMLLTAESRLRDKLMASLETLAADELRVARREIARTLVGHLMGAELKNFEAHFGAAPVSGNGLAQAVNFGGANARSTGHESSARDRPLDESPEASVL